MNQLEEFLSGRRRGEAQARAATVKGPVGDGTGDYACVDNATGEVVRASVAASGVTFAKRFPVVLTRNDDGTVAKTGGLVIQQNRAIAAKGTIYSHPSSSEADYATAAVVMINPESASFVATQTQTIVIYGTGLADAVLDYGTADLTDASAPVMTPTRITLSVVCGGLPALGSFDLTVAGVVFSNFFTITT